MGGRKIRVVFVVVMIFMPSIVFAQSNAPYPASTTLSGVTWDHAHVITLAPGSDLWPMTWAGDGNVYAVGGDGGGFNGNNDTCRARTTLARITGSPPSITGENLSGCMADGTGCSEWNVHHDAACDSPHATGWDGVPDTILAVGNTLHMIPWIFTDPPTRKIYHTSNFGQTWTSNSWVWTLTPGSGNFFPGAFINFGQGYAGARDNYVYLLGSKEGARGTYLARVPQTSLGTQGAYEYFTGTANKPTWGTWGNSTPIYQHADRNSGINIVYFPVLKRYIAVGLHGAASDDPGEGQIQALGVFEAPEPWGPWKTVYYSDNWGNYGTTHGLSNNISPKWISSDNKTFYMTFSGPGYDSFNLIKGTFTLGTPVGAIPNVPNNLNVTKGKTMAGY